MSVIVKINKYLCFSMKLSLYCFVFSVTLLSGCVMYKTAGMQLNEVVNKMYTDMTKGNYTYLEKLLYNKARDYQNPFKVYVIEVLNYNIKDIRYADEKNATVTMELTYKYEGKKTDSFTTADVWIKIDGDWRLIDLNSPIDDSQKGYNYRVKPYIFDPEKFKH